MIILIMCYEDWVYAPYSNSQRRREERNQINHITVQPEIIVDLLYVLMNDSNSIVDKHFNAHICNRDEHASEGSEI